jgi:hypothetical protein
VQIARPGSVEELYVFVKKAAVDDGLCGSVLWTHARSGTDSSCFTVGICSEGILVDLADKE